MGAEQKKKKRMRNRVHQIVQYFLRQILRHAYGVTSVNHADAKMGNIQKKDMVKMTSTCKNDCTASFLNIKNIGKHT
jgi:hypothetical protein